MNVVNFGKINLLFLIKLLFFFIEKKSLKYFWMSIVGFISKIYILVSKINEKSKMLCGLKISFVIFIIDLFFVSWFNYFFFLVNELSFV